MVPEAARKRGPECQAGHEGTQDRVTATPSPRAQRQEPHPEHLVHQPRRRRRRRRAATAAASAGAMSRDGSTMARGTESGERSRDGPATRRVLNSVPAARAPRPGIAAMRRCTRRIASGTARRRGNDGLLVDERVRVSYHRASGRGESSRCTLLHQLRVHGLERLRIGPRPAPCPERGGEPRAMRHGPRTGGWEVSKNQLPPTSPWALAVRGAGGPSTIRAPVSLATARIAW